MLPCTNVQERPVEPQVNSAKTRKLFNAGVSASAQIGKSADPSCYHPPVSRKAGPAVDAAGLFENQIRRENMSDMMNPIRKYFTVETAPRQPDKWLIVCPKCNSMWHLAKDNTHPGNVLHLLNHARGHDEPKPRGKRNQAALDALNG